MLLQPIPILLSLAGEFFEQKLMPPARVFKRDCTRSGSLVEIRNSFGMIGQTNQSNSTHDHRPTNYNSKRYDCRMYNSGEKGQYPENDADDTQTHPDYDFHLGSVLVSLAKGEPDARDRWHGEARRAMLLRYGLPQPPLGPRQSA